MMHEYSCTDVRDRLEAFHDGELAITERIALQSHLGDCGACSCASTELASIGATLRDLASQVAEDEPVERLRISAHVLEQFIDWLEGGVFLGTGASIVLASCSK